MTSVRYRHFTIEEYEAKVEARFWSYVHKTDTCWLWTGPVSSVGYGEINVVEYPASRITDGAKKRKIGAHRYSWEKASGPIPDAFDIDHKCHVRLCVNPEHLRPTTRKQNIENHSGPTAKSTSGVRGVYWYARRGVWTARVGHNGRQVHVGEFHDLAEAEAAVVARRNELHTHNDLDRTAV